MFGLGVIAVVAAVRSYEHIPDLVIKIIAGWGALVMALFAPFVVVTLAWGRIKTRYKKLTIVLFAACGVVATVLLLRYALLAMF